MTIRISAALSLWIFLSVMFSCTFAQDASIPFPFAKPAGKPVMKISPTFTSGGKPDSSSVDTRTLTLQRVIQIALWNYPSLREAQARISSAQAGVNVAKTAYLPSLDLFSQNNLGTYNKLPGLFFPQTGIMSVAGPSPQNQIYNFVFGEYSGAMLTWTAYDFGYRQAEVDRAKAATKVAVSGKALTKLEVLAGAVEAYLKVQAAERVVSAAQANLTRTELFGKSVAVLVKSGLRPGVDASRALADVAAARTKWIQAKEQRDIGKAFLAQAMGIAGEDVAFSPEPFLDDIPNIPVIHDDVAAHPLLGLQQSKIGLIQAQEKSTQRSYWPKLFLQGGVNGRGSDLDFQGKDVGNGRGLYPTRANFGLNVDLVFNPTQIFIGRAQLKQIRFDEAAERARYDEIMQGLIGALSQAKAQINAALQVARNTPVAVNAALMTEIQSSARYKAGLATLVDVADAQRLLVDAQIDDALAKLGVWTSLLHAAKAKGNLDPFIQLASFNPFPAAAP